MEFGENLPKSQNEERQEEKLVVPDVTTKLSADEQKRLAELEESKFCIPDAGLPDHEQAEYEALLLRSRNSNE